MRYTTDSRYEPAFLLATLVAWSLWMAAGNYIGFRPRGLWENAGAVDALFYISLGWFIRSVIMERST